MSSLGLSICVSGYNAENIKQALSRSENSRLEEGYYPASYSEAVEKGWISSESK